METPAAAIDLGTNTARLLIGYREPAGVVKPLLVKRWITRLGGGFSRELGISEEAKIRTVAALKDFAVEIKKHGVARVRAVATSAVRDAVNGKALCDDIFEETGIRLEILGCREEGLLTLRGVFAGIDDPEGDVLVFDVGGGSTEYTLTRNREPIFTESLPLGVVRLTEGKKDQDAMEDKVLRELANTATTLAAISLKLENYDYRLVNNYSLSLDKIRQIYATLLPMTPDERLNVIGLEKGREDLIIAGILITLKTMELFGFQKLKVSDFGLLEGLFLET